MKIIQIVRVKQIKQTVLAVSVILFSLLSPVRTSDWNTTSGSLVYKNKTHFDVKGINWFGFETCDFVLHGLWVHPITWYLDFLQKEHFNVLRVPFSEQWVNSGFETQFPANQKVAADPSLQGKRSVEILDVLFEECRKRGIFILLDMHRLKCDAQSHEVWYSTDGGSYTHETFFSAWRRILSRYQHYTNFHGIDLLNEPRGRAQWGVDPSTSWNKFVESSFENLPDYDGLVYVEGTNWGKSFNNMQEFSINVREPSRLVFSPHVYGPSVIGNINLEDTALRGEWQKEFGYLVPQQKTVVLGEWGGRYEASDKDWHDKLVSYLLENHIPGMYWCLNPNSGDTGGVLQDDWTSPRTDKLQLLSRLQPHPTITVIPPNQLRYLRRRVLWY